MIKKTIAILSVFAVLFGMSACKNGLEGNLEGNTTTPAGEETTLDLGATELFVEDGNGNLIPVVTNKNNKGEIIYEYTDANGNKVTETDKNNVVGVTKYSEKEQAQIQLEQVSKLFEENPDAFLEDTEIDFILSDGLVPEDQMKKVEVELGSDGKPARDDSKSYQSIIGGNAFTVSMNIQSIMAGQETNVPMTWIKSGDSFLMELVTPADVTGAAMKTNILYKDNKCYVYFPAVKVYAEMPTDALEELFNPEIFESEVEENVVYDATYEFKSGGKTYYCDVYKAKEGDAVTKNYFDSKGNPVRVEMIAADDVTIWEITEISSNADASKLKIPTGYINLALVYGEDFDFGFNG